ncbi:basic leucine zipper 61-like [Dioscorea cayenensis subsp. rotundata]|uniref:Basic leucine zipper 61-like n=1 Tax=Dioscorea cayennensis subsp. rotundata TaxID=55577 RepID=A0AB40B363_DIOCR|nr:basic leucine zipper 61-like [Dioscorea cayenensis subsp. rotundata]
MAQLPPKVPSNWPSFGHQRAPSMASFLPPAPAPPPSSGNHPSWVDEFLDFTLTRRGAHRRSMSDSVAFLEAPMISSNGGGAPMHEFDRLDEDQLISMFPDDLPPSSGASAAPLSSSTPSTPSDHNSVNEENPSEQQLVNELEETQSLCKSEPQTNQAAHTAAASTADQIIVDPKRVKRILANRQSAQRSRVRKLQYISELERSVTSLQTEVSALSPRVAFLDHQRSVLTVGNSHLKQRIAALAQDKIFKDAHQEALKKEIERLRQVYHQQSLKKMPSVTAGDSPEHTNKELVS